jgi:hypothetical protein
MFPEGSMSSLPMAAPFLAPDDTNRLNNLLQDKELGGIALNDPSEGLTYQVWDIYYDGADARLHNENGYDEPIVSSEFITELSLSFDQNMRPAVAYVDSGVTKLLWYDSEIAAQVTTVVPNATSPMLGLDTKRIEFTDISDIVLVYLNQLNVCYRVQRERFLIEHVAGVVQSSSARILGAGMNKGNRFQIYIRSTD